MASTHITNITGRIRILNNPPSDPVDGDEFFDKDNNGWFRYDAGSTTWLGTKFTKTNNNTSTGIAPENPATHFASLANKRRTGTADPSNPEEGDFYYNTSTNVMNIYVNDQWSTKTFTSTSTSTTTTSTSSSTSSSTSTSTSTSTTTTSTSTTTTL